MEVFSFASMGGESDRKSEEHNVNHRVNTLSVLTQSQPKEYSWYQDSAH